MSTFNLEIVATDKIFYQGPCESLVFPGIDGEHGILARHETMVAAVKAGELRCIINGEQKGAAVGDGFIEVSPEKVVVIVDFAERPEDIDIKRAERAKERAEERLRLKRSEKEYVHSQAALSRAMARLKVSQRNMQR